MIKSNIAFILCLLSSIVCFNHPALSQEQEQDYEIAYKKAVQLMDAGKTQEGFEYLNKSIGINPRFYDALYARSYYFMREGKYLKAIRDYDLLILLYPNVASLYLYRGQAKFYLENYESAETDYRKGYQLDSTYIEVINALGSLYFVMDLYKDATTYFNKTLKLDAKNVYAYYYRASTYYYTQQYDLALKDIASCLGLAPKDADAKRLKALVHLGMKKPKKAIDIYEKLQKEKTTFEEEDFYNWGLAYYQLRKYSRALFYLQTPQKHENSSIYHYIGKTKYKLKDTRAALSYLNKAIKLVGKDNEASATMYYDRAVVYYRMRRPKQARKDFLEGIFLMPELLTDKDLINRMNLLGNAQIMLKLDDKKEKPLLDSISTQGYQARAETFISLGDSKNALVELKKAIELAPNNSYSYTLRGIAHAMRNAYNEAVQDFNKALKLPKNRNAEKTYYSRGLTYKELGMYKEAQTSITQAITLNKKVAEYYYDRAIIAYEVRNLEGALQDINEAIKLAPKKLDYYTDRALYLSEKKQYKEALADCNRVLKEDSNNVMAYYSRGLAYDGLGKYAEAVADFSKVLTVYPNDREVNLLLRKSLSKMHQEKN
ncbi:tetratricopeptide repeat protein [uncultured Microscilla sp.]|uniref:tetratricopeptide repeat protein n=1 Tax=uncultured Microscilla sp. TaxID=432653 RepID=UPI0026141BD3|nr:tetratricopeptide repeat protein [uncultured Microscilla sp.]